MKFWVFRKSNMDQFTEKKKSMVVKVITWVCNRDESKDAQDSSNDGENVEEVDINESNIVKV